MKLKIIWLLSSVFAVFVIGSLLATSHVATTTEELDRLLNLHKIENMRVGLVESIRTVQADLHLARSPIPVNLDSIIRNASHLEKASHTCAGCHHKPELMNKFYKIEKLVRDYQQALSFFITASADAERIGRLDINAVLIGEELLALTEELSLSASGKLDRMTAVTLDEIKNVRFILLITLAFTVFVSAIMSLNLIRSILTPINQLMVGTRRITEGELGHQIEIAEKTEFKELAEDFNSMSTGLKDVYLRLEQTNDELSHEMIERKQAEDQRRDLMDQLLHAKKMQAVGVLSAGISHEFNNLLQIIQGTADLMHISMDKADPAYGRVEAIQSAAQRGTNLTQQLLAFSRKMEVAPVAIDVNTRVGQAKSILEKTLPKNIKLETLIDCENCTVLVDQSSIEQILLNLALNAGDAMPDGGTLRLITRRVPASEVPATVGIASDCALIQVTDTGHGMSEETLEHIFDPFFTTKEVGAGTGLGLSVTYGIIQTFGGMILCESSPGEGTVFSIYLPLVEGSAVATVCETRPAAAQSNVGETVMMVDDEEAILSTGRDILEDAGYKVLIARSGEEALEIFKKQAGEIDIVVLDLGMPGMGGRECLIQMAQLDPTARILISTGYGIDGNEFGEVELSYMGLLPKPFRLKDLLEAVDKGLGRA